MGGGGISQDEGKNMKEERVIIAGDETAVSGTYLLQIEVADAIAVRFGRFRGGMAIPVPAGSYVYVGSAMRALGSRLLRHASRTDPVNPHPIRPLLAQKLQAANVKGRIPQQKRLHWHVDYLLEQPEATLTQVIIRRSRQRLEASVADWLMGSADTAVLAPGIGASDHYGRSHLLQLRNSNQSIQSAFDF